MKTAELIEQLLRAGTSVRFKATGSSMEPSIRSGDIITAGPCCGQNLRDGVIICFRHEQEMRVHRIIGRRENCEGFSYLARGDALNAFMEKVRPQEVLGLVTSVERNGIPVDFNLPFRKLRSFFRRLFRKMTN